MYSLTQQKANPFSGNHFPSLFAPKVRVVIEII